MIEFKAECGHTVRARDEDAGGVVRCTYCGCDAAVPDAREEALDFLFDDVDRAASAMSDAAVGGRRGRRFSFRRKPGRAGGFNPFPIIIRLCYAALLISVLIVVTRKFVMPLFDGNPADRRIVAKKRDVPKKIRRNPREAAPAANRMGLLARNALAGLYVASTPPGAMVYCVKSEDAPASGRVHQVRGCSRFQTPGQAPRLPDGTYVVELVLPWNDPSLKRYAGYTPFRRAIERADDKERRLLAEAYFVPDEASEVFIDETVDQKYVVRQYRDVVIRDGQSSGVRALFLPRTNDGDNGSLSIEELVVKYIPGEVAYRFKEDHVVSELEYYGVVESDRPWVVKALARIGVIPYVTPEGRTLIFKIGVEDGVFAARVVRERREDK